MRIHRIFPDNFFDDVISPFFIPSELIDVGNDYQWLLYHKNSESDLDEVHDVT